VGGAAKNEQMLGLVFKGSVCGHLGSEGSFGVQVTSLIALLGAGMDRLSDRV